MQLAADSKVFENIWCYMGCCDRLIAPYHYWDIPHNVLLRVGFRTYRLDRGLGGGRGMTRLAVSKEGCRMTRSLTNRPRCSRLTTSVHRIHGRLSVQVGAARTISNIIPRQRASTMQDRGALNYIAAVACFIMAETPPPRFVHQL